MYCREYSGPSKKFIILGDTISDTLIDTLIYTLSNSLSDTFSDTFSDTLVLFYHQDMNIL